MVVGRTLQQHNHLFDKTTDEKEWAIGKFIRSSAFFVIARPTYFGLNIGQNFPESVIDSCVRKGVVTIESPKKCIEIGKVIILMLHNHALPSYSLSVANIHR